MCGADEDRGIVLTERDQKLYLDTESYLGLLEKRLRQRTERLALGTGAGSGTPAGLGTRGGFAPWTREDLRQLERNLNDWIRRFQLVYSVIDAEITVKRSSSLGSGASAQRVNALLNI